MSAPDIAQEMRRQWGVLPGPPRTKTTRGLTSPFSPFSGSWRPGLWSDPVKTHSWSGPPHSREPESADSVEQRTNLTFRSSGGRKTATHEATSKSHCRQAFNGSADSNSFCGPGVNEPALRERIGQTCTQKGGNTRCFMKTNTSAECSRWLVGRICSGLVMGVQHAEAKGGNSL